MQCQLMTMLLFVLFLAFKYFDIITYLYFIFVYTSKNDLVASIDLFLYIFRLVPCLFLCVPRQNWFPNRRSRVTRRRCTCDWEWANHWTAREPWPHPSCRTARRRWSPNTGSASHETSIKTCTNNITFIRDGSIFVFLLFLPPLISTLHRCHL